MAGVDRFELSRARVKVLCLTAWRYPIAYNYILNDFAVLKYLINISGASRGDDALSKPFCEWFVAKVGSNL